MVRPYKGILRGNKRNEVLTQATTRMNLQNIIWSERRQSQKDLYDSVHKKYPEMDICRDGKGIRGCLERGCRGTVSSF